MEKKPDWLKVRYNAASAPLARSSYRAWEALEETHDLY